MRVRWLTPILGGICLISAFFIGNIDDHAFYALSEQAQAHYHHNAVIGGLVGLGISLAVVLLGLRDWLGKNPADRQSGRPACLGAVLAVIASVFWLAGLLFPPYEF